MKFTTEKCIIALTLSQLIAKILYCVVSRLGCQFNLIYFEMLASSIFVWLSIHSVPHETLLGSNNLFKILHDRLKIKKRK